MITIVRRMPKHKSVLREQAQQINFKSVLPEQNTFKSVSNCQTLSKVFNPLGLLFEHTFGEKLFQRYIHFLGDFKIIWNCAKIFFLLRPQYCLPFFLIQCFQEETRKMFSWRKGGHCPPSSRALIVRFFQNVCNRS